MRWGLIPGWWKKSRKDVPATFNARAETVAEKPMFRGAFKDRRCIIPASGFYEWTGEQGRQAAASLHRGRRLAGAGLRRALGSLERSRQLSTRCSPATIIVSGASAWMTPYHDRMPVLLEATGFRCMARRLARAGRAETGSRRKAAGHLVSPRLNRTGVGDDDPTIIEPVALI